MNASESSLITIAMPFYENYTTLPIALASVVAQTWKNWECLIIDDGSQRSAVSICEQFRDARIKYFRQEKNHGRGFARQMALDNTRGKYLTMVDADDWIYPNRLEHQVMLLEAHPEIALVSSAMAIVKDRGQLAGVRRFQSDKKLDPDLRLPMTCPRPLSISHAGSMIRGSVAKKYKYDTSLKTSEDFDFLLQILLENKFATCPHVLYAYTEFHTLSGAKIFSSLNSRHKILKKYLKRFPIAVGRELLFNEVKRITYFLIFSFGLQDHLIRQRTQAASHEERDSYQKSVDIINSILAAKGFESV